MKHIYLVLFDWSVEDDTQIETYVYKNYEDAVKKFNEIITGEMDPVLSWVGDEAFNRKGKIKKGFIFHKFTDQTTGKDLFWHVADYNNQYRYSFINIYKKEIL